MMNTVKRIGNLILLAVFLFGITGLSIFHHNCTSSNQQRISLYAEIFREAPGSCCGDEVTEPSGHVAVQQQFDAVPCCKSTNIFLTLHFFSERLPKLVVQTVETAAVPFLTPLCPVAAIDQQPLAAGLFRVHSPPLFGKQLIHFLHQIKIPALSAIA